THDACVAQPDGRGYQPGPRRRHPLPSVLADRPENQSSRRGRAHALQRMWATWAGPLPQTSRSRERLAARRFGTVWRRAFLAASAPKPFGAGRAWLALGPKPFGTGRAWGQIGFEPFDI